MALKLCLNDAFISELPVVHTKDSKTVYELVLPLVVSIVDDGEEDSISELEMIRRTSDLYHFADDGTHGGWWCVRSKDNTWYVARDGCEAYRTGLTEDEAVRLAFELSNVGSADLS